MNNNKYMLSSLITELLSKVFNLDTTMIFPLLTIIIDEIGFDSIFSGLMGSKWIIFSFMCIYFIVKNTNFSWILSRLRYKSKNSKNEINIYDINTVNLVGKYFKMCCDVDCKNINIGDIDEIKYKITKGINFMALDFSNIPNTDRFFKFTDTNKNISGQIAWIKMLYNKATTCKNCNSDIVSYEPLIYIRLIINEDGYDLQDYIEHIKEYVTINSENVDLKYVKIMKDNDDKNNTDGGKSYNHTVQYHYGKKETDENLKKRYFDSFFHKDKEYYYNHFMKMKNNPEFFEQFGQQSRSNMILYGPPGSGKSSFINRVAKIMNRHIISIDLSNIQDKNRIYQIIQRPHIDEFPHNPEDVIIVLEEFDIVVKQLMERENIIRSLNERINNTEESKELTAIILELERIKKKILLRDLLDIFQGTVTINGTIIFATTNKLDEIKDVCPELFREGRLTPVYFGYFDRSLFDKFTKYYFNKTVKDSGRFFADNGEMKYATSHLIETALKVKIVHKDNDVAFDSFISII